MLLAAIVVHVHAAFSLWALSNEARPRTYYQRKDLATNYAALTMRYGGLTLLAFIIYHMLHLTVGVTGHVGYEFVPGDVYNNLVLGIQRTRWSRASTSSPWAPWACTSITASGASRRRSVPTIPSTTPLRTAAAAGLTLIIVLGFISVPISVLTGILEPMASSAVVVEEAAE